jgi:hypothetical protein
MKPSQKPAFSKVTECPQCGAPLKITNTSACVIRQCSEDYAHYISETPVPSARKHLILVTQPDTSLDRVERAGLPCSENASPDISPHAELTYEPHDYEPDTYEPDIYEPDADELAERAAICAVECGIEFDEEGHITYVPPGVPDCIIDAVMRE